MIRELSKESSLIHLCTSKITMPRENDLSEYEKVRLANINRNAEFLLSMGFGAPSKLIDDTKKSTYA